MAVQSRHAPGVKDVAAAAGVSLGHRLQRAQPPRPGQRRDPRAGRAGHGRPRLRPQRGRPAAAGRPQPHHRLRHARRRQPVLHRRRAGHRARRRGGGPVGLHLQQRQLGRARGRLPRAGSSRCGCTGVLITPVDPDHPLLQELPRRGTPVVIVDRTGSLDTPLLRSPSTTSSAARSRPSTCSTWGTSGIAFVGGPDTLGQVRTGGAAPSRPLAEAGLPAGPAHRDRHLRADRRRGPRGRRAAGRAARRRPADRGLLRQRPARARPAAAVRQPRPARCPSDLAIVGYDDIEFAAAAAVPLTSVRQPRRRARRDRRRAAARRGHDRRHEHQRVLFTPELVVRGSTMRPS